MVVHRPEVLNRVETHDLWCGTTFKYSETIWQINNFLYLILDRSEAEGRSPLRSAAEDRLRRTHRQQKPQLVRRQVKIFNLIQAKPSEAL